MSTSRPNEIQLTAIGSGVILASIASKFRCIRYVLISLVRKEDGVFDFHSARERVDRE